MEKRFTETEESVAWTSRTSGFHVWVLSRVETTSVLGDVIVSGKFKPGIINVSRAQEEECQSSAELVFRLSRVPVLAVSIHFRSDHAGRI